MLRMMKVTVLARRLRSFTVSKFSRALLTSLILLQFSFFTLAFASNLASEKQPAVEEKLIEVTLREGTNMAAALSPDGKTLALDLLGRIWLLPATGGEAQPLTDPLGDARQPAWSPDGERIAFQAYWDGNWHIYTVDRDGDLEQLTHGLFDHREPHWSPDGSTIAFSSDRSGNYDIYTLNLSSGEITQITEDGANDYGPAWSPDGAHIAYISDRNEDGGIWAWSKNEDSVRRIVSPRARIAGPSWSPDGKKIVFNARKFGESNLMLARFTDGVDESPAVISKPEEDVFPFRASWLSGDEILYTGTGQIQKRTLSGKNRGRVSFSATVSLNRPAYQRRKRNFDPEENLPVRGIAWPAISPDGKKIAFVALGDLWVQEIGGKPERLTHDAFVETAPVWSPDGKSLAFTSDREGSLDLWVRDLASDEETRLTQLPGPESNPAWSPDGSKIAFTMRTGVTRGSVSIVEVETRKASLLRANLPSPGRPTWSPDGQMLAVSVLKPYSGLYREGVNQITLFSVDGKRIEEQKGLEHWSVGARLVDGPAWSPDGKNMAFVSSGVLWVMPVDTQGQPLGPPKRLTNELADMPSWTGDSKNLLYMATDKLKLISVMNGATRNVAIDLTWSRKAPEGKTVIQVGGLFDGRSSKLQKNVDIVIERNRIVAIEKHDPNRKADKIVDAKNAFAMPGLIDMHAHQGSEFGEGLGRLWLSWGVTSTRDPSSNPYDGLNRREAHEAGLRPGARIFFTGSPIDGNRIYYSGMNAQQSPAQLELELERARKLDYDLIKTYVRLPDALQKRVIEFAHEIGIPVTSHELYPAISYGGDGFEHIRGTSRRGYSPKVSNTSRTYGDVISLLGATNMTITPTAALHGGIAVLLARDLSVLDDRRLREIDNPFMAQMARRRAMGVRNNQEAWNRIFKNIVSTVKNIVEAGGNVVAGTDSPIIPYGFSLHIELQCYVEGGLTPFQALRTATVNAAKLLGVEDDLGAIEAGKLADIVIVTGNPLDDIRNTRKVRTVIQNGRVYEFEALFKKPVRLNRYQQPKG